jgi:hypothetical protein
LLYGLSIASRQAAFYDVFYGSNQVPPGGDYSVLNAGFKAHAGWDAATGLGAPFARNLIKAIVGI